MARRSGDEDLLGLVRDVLVDKRSTWPWRRLLAVAARRGFVVRAQLTRELAVDVQSVYASEAYEAVLVVREPGSTWDEVVYGRKVGGIALVPTHGHNPGDEDLQRLARATAQGDVRAGLRLLKAAVRYGDPDLIYTTVLDAAVEGSDRQEGRDHPQRALIDLVANAYWWVRWSAGGDEGAKSMIAELLNGERDASVLGGHNPGDEDLRDLERAMSSAQDPSLVQRFVVEQMRRGLTKARTLALLDRWSGRDLDRWSLVVLADEASIGTPYYLGRGYFWHHDYRHYLRDTTPACKRAVHDAWLKAGLALDGSSAEHSRVLARVARSNRVACAGPDARSRLRRENPGDDDLRDLERRAAAGDRRARAQLRRERQRRGVHDPAFDAARRLARRVRRMPNRWSVDFDRGPGFDAYLHLTGETDYDGFLDEVVPQLPERWGNELQARGDVLYQATRNAWHVYDVNGDYVAIVRRKVHYREGHRPNPDEDRRRRSRGHGDALDRVRAAADAERLDGAAAAFEAEVLERVVSQGYGTLAHAAAALEVLFSSEQIGTTAEKTFWYAYVGAPYRTAGVPWRAAWERATFGMPPAPAGQISELLAVLGPDRPTTVSALEIEIPPSTMWIYQHTGPNPSWLQDVFDIFDSMTAGTVPSAVRVSREVAARWLVLFRAQGPLTGDNPSSRRNRRLSRGHR